MPSRALPQAGVLRRDQLSPIEATTLCVRVSVIGRAAILSTDVRYSPFQPNREKSLPDTVHVGGRTFILPSELEKVGDKKLLEPPASLTNDSRVVGSEGAFIQQFVM
jgi:hypothetical protein